MSKKYSDQEFQDDVLKAVGEIALAVSQKGGFRRPHSHSTQAGLREACEQILASSPEKRAWLRAVFKYHGRVSPNEITADELALAKSTFSKSLTQGTDPGASLVSMELSADIYSLMFSYGAWRTLGVIPVGASDIKALTVSGKADGYWLSKTRQGTTIPADCGITGTSVSDEIETLATLVEVSNEALSDGKTTFEGAILQAVVEGLNSRLEWACFSADGTDDTTDGAQTGIFADAAVHVSNATAGNISVPTLDFDDFKRCIQDVAPSALQRPCRWWIAPAFLPSLLSIKDDIEYVLKRPRATGEDWMLLGFPVTWTAAAPAVDGTSKPVAAFGRGDAYAVMLRQEFEITRSGSRNFHQNLSLIRAIIRARCKMRDATSFSILKTAAI